MFSALTEAWQIELRKDNPDLPVTGTFASMTKSLSPSLEFGDQGVIKGYAVYDDDGYFGVQTRDACQNCVLIKAVLFIQSMICSKIMLT